MTQRVDIMNMALSWLGANQITSIEDDNTEARQMYHNYTLAKDAVLEQYNWSFAMKRFVPGKLAEEAEFGNLNLFAIPSDIMRVVAVYKDNISWLSNYEEEQADWVIESGNILSSWDVIYCKGIRYMEDEGSFSPLFNNALAAKLAYLTAFNLTGSRAIEESMGNRYAHFITEAQSLDAMQGRSRRIRNRSKQRARMGARRDW